MFLIQHPCFKLNKRIAESIMLGSYQEYDPQSIANPIIHDNTSCLWKLNSGIKNYFRVFLKKKYRKKILACLGLEQSHESCRGKNTIDCSQPQREFQLRTAFHVVPSQKLHNAASCCNIVADLWTCSEKECEKSASFAWPSKTNKPIEALCNSTNSIITSMIRT